MNFHPEILAKSLANGGTSLYEHLKHVAEVTGFIAKKLGFDTVIAQQGAILHDVGKAHPDFQNKLKGIYDPFEIDFRHEIASIFFLSLADEENQNQLIDMIIAHHRSPEKDAREQGIIDLIELEGEDEVFLRHFDPWDKWASIALDILSAFNFKVRNIDITEAKNKFEYVINYCANKNAGWSKYKGLLISADHLASALNEKTSEATANLFNLPDLAFFNSKERNNKLYPLSLISATDKKQHTLVTAPTGAGKTDFLMRRCKSRIFYTLPFQASINAMYERFKSCLPKDTDLRVLHAASRMLFKDRTSYEERAMQPMIGAGIKVLTPHQLAALISGTKGFESIAIDVEGCDVILDEIHSYSAVAQSMVIEIIKVLLKLDCRIHIGTATMPTALANNILELLGGKETTYVVNLDQNTLDTFNRHKIFKHQNFDKLLSITERAIAKEDKVLLVCNRVDRAQDHFIKLSKHFPDVPIMLIHSRFRRIDRNVLEKELKENFNDRNRIPGKCIVISTQVVEVSLDINFDLMITEAAPIDAMIQRFGRINRKRTAQSIQNKIIKEIHVIAPPDDARDCLPYNKEIIKKSYEILPESNILFERDIQKMLDSVYPEIESIPINTHLVWEGDNFLLKELCHYPYSVLLNSLNIESGCCIRFSDKEEYETAKTDVRIGLEIPVPRSIMYRKFTNYGKSKYGNQPIIISDELYNQKIGLKWKEIDNIF